MHPGFTFGNTQLSGIWVAKYEASSTDPNKTEATGTYYAGANTGGGNVNNLQVRVLPDVYSWRNVNVGNTQTVSMSMTNSDGSVGTTVNLDTHLIKNMEWGVIAYFSQSKYGQEPWINPYGDQNNNSRKMKTGYAGLSKDTTEIAEGSMFLYKYNTKNGVKATTTGNIYGIYDISGGAWERTASFIDNGNVNLSLYGKKEHFQNNKLNQEYAKYYDIYEPGDEEKEGGAFYGVNGQNLWNSVAPYNVSQESNNVIRKRLTEATYAKFANKKGDALWETSNGISYYGRYTSGTTDLAWLKNTTRASSSGEDYTTCWNGDYMHVGLGYRCFLGRGGFIGNTTYAGLYSYLASYGDPSPSYGFRPVLVIGNSL